MPIVPGLEYIPGLLADDGSAFEISIAGIDPAMPVLALPPTDAPMTLGVVEGRNGFWGILQGCVGIGGFSEDALCGSVHAS